MIYHILLGVSAVLLAVDFSINKKYQSCEGAGLVPGLKYNAINGLFTAVVFFAISGFHLDFSAFSIWMAFAQSFCCLFYSLIGFRILKNGNMALYSLFLMSGGMILPYLFGIAFLGEPLTAVRVVGLLLMLAAIVISSEAKISTAKAVLPLCAAIFLLNGMVSIISKCHQIDTTHHAVSSQQFVILTGLTKFLMSGMGLVLCKPKEEKLTLPAKPMLGLIVGSAAIGGLSYMLQLVGAAHLPATVTYPLITGGSIVFSTLADVVFFKERTSKRQWLSVILCLVGTCFFL